MIKIKLKKGREGSLKRFHPWVFSGAISSIEGEPKEGDIVSIYAHDGALLGCGHYQIGSISVRILSFDAAALLPDFWEVKISEGLKAREAYGLANSNQTTCYRLIHGEGDNLPGLIIDFYDGTAVIQTHTSGMFLSRKKIVEALKKVYGLKLKAVYDKSSGTAPFKVGLELNDGYLYKRDKDEPNESIVLENGHKFLVDWEKGQKTGFFLDQRENRLKVEKYAAGRRILNLFCYTGGFSIYAIAGGAVKVDSVDSSAKAIEMLEKNMFLNGFDLSTEENMSADKIHTSYCEDAIEFLKKSPENKYDLMIVDPPAFAKHRVAIDNALRAYQKLNTAAISKIAPGGIIFTFSCSQVIDKNAFALAVFSAAAQTGRKVRIIDRMNQPADHAVNIYHPEGEYLKGLILYVE
jgi:23S rRNA (cytosine1962-C5)-methyltransferase